MKNVIVVGAGKTGRGFVGRLLAEAGVGIVFVDKNAELVARLNAEGSFPVRFFSDCREPVTVENYRAYTWEDATPTLFADAELVFVSVGGQNLRDVGAALNERLPERRTYLITCENASDPVGTLKSAIPDRPVAVSEATVFCTTVDADRDGLAIASENYPYLQCNADLLEGYRPPVESVRPMANFSNFLTRKLFTYNAASCVIAYLGARKGYTDYGEAANDPEILALLDRNYAATNAAMCKAYGYEPADQAQFAALSKAKFTDRTIVDSVARNAREPHRKLGPKERIIGAAKLLRDCGEDAEVLAMTAAAALLYEDPADATWSALRAEQSPEQILTGLCGLSPDDGLYGQILTFVHQFQNG